MPLAEEYIVESIYSLAIVVIGFAGWATHMVGGLVFFLSTPKEFAARD